MSTVAKKSEKQRAAEAAVKDFKEDLGPFVAAERTRMAMVFSDAKADGNPIIFANDSFLALTGYERKEVLGQSFNFMLAGVADAGAFALIQREFDGKTVSGSEIRYRRKDGHDFWATLFVSPVRDEAGEIVQYFASFADVTRYKDDLVQSKMLIAELNHRVKNTLATVQSIVFQALRTATQPQSIHDAIESRLLALSRSHDLLTRENWKSAGLRDIIKDALEPFNGSGLNERFLLHGGNVRFSPKATLALGIAFNELATNAAKYGALSVDTGAVDISWSLHTVSSDRRLKLVWREMRGPEVTTPTRKGFGTRVIERGLAHELQGEANLDYRKDGLVFTMDVPAPKAPYHE
jgi:PAS domain S-box-containing protein